MPRKLYSYDNFDIDVNSPSFLFLIWGLYAGILLGVLFSLITRVHSYKVIHALTENGAEDRESAKTLDELGFGKNLIIKRMLRTNAPLRKLVLCANETELPPRKMSGIRRFWREKFLKDPLPPKTDFSIARFYLPEEKRVTAEVRYTVEGHPIRNFILAVVGLTAVALFTVFALPELLTMLDNLITQLRPRSRYY